MKKTFNLIRIVRSNNFTISVQLQSYTYTSDEQYVSIQPPKAKFTRKQKVQLCFSGQLKKYNMR